MYLACFSLINRSKARNRIQLRTTPRAVDYMVFQSLNTNHTPCKMPGEALPNQYLRTSILLLLFIGTILSFDIERVILVADQYGVSDQVGVDLRELTGINVNEKGKMIEMLSQHY